MMSGKIYFVPGAVACGCCSYRHDLTIRRSVILGITATSLQFVYRLSHATKALGFWCANTDFLLLAACEGDLVVDPNQRDCHWPN